MTRYVTAIAALAILNACASANPTYTQEGKAGYVINCSGTARTWGMCQEKAGELCGARGYNVLNTSGDQGFVVSGTQTGAFAGSVISRTMLIECKP